MSEKTGLELTREAVKRVLEGTTSAAVHDEREAFEKWLGIKPCGAAHDFGWAAWQARAALAATPSSDMGIPIAQSNQHVAAAAPVAIPEPRWHNPRMYDAAHFPYYTPDDVRALLATGGQGMADALNAENIKALIEVSRMPNQEHVADAHNAAVRHLRAIAAAKEVAQK